MSSIKHNGYGACKIDIPELVDLYQDVGTPPPATRTPPVDGEIVAMGCGTYLGFHPDAYDSHRLLTARLAGLLGGNLWLLKSKARLPYPYAPLYAVAGMLQTEHNVGRKADWLLWLDDDVVVTPDCFDVLRAAADPVERPFVSVVALDRSPPFRVAAWNEEEMGKLQIKKQWIAPDPDHMPDESKYKLKPNEMWMPPEGVHEVTCCGLCAALIHRSLFDTIPQPWFAVLPGATDLDGTVAHKINPDSWWCQQLHDHGVKIHVTCDTLVTHLGSPLPVNRHTAWALRKVFSG